MLLPTRLLLAALLLAAGQGPSPQPPTPAAWTPPPFPRLLGMNIGAKHYDDPRYQQQMARLHVVIIGTYKGWKPSYGLPRLVDSLHAQAVHKPLLVGQYTVLNEAQDNPRDTASADIQAKLNAMNWWARNAAGDRVQWTKTYGAWDIDFTASSPADPDGLRYPQWLANRNDEVYFRAAPFDIWYLDNVFDKPRVVADWNRDGRDDPRDDPAACAAYRAGHRAGWDHIRKIHPGLLLMANADNPLSAPEYRGQLEGAFLEGLMGKNWSIERQKGWPAAMQRYRDALANTRPPHLVGFNVAGRPDDLRFLRYALASCLLDDGYFSYTDESAGYSSVPWFDEFDQDLGMPTSPPPTAPWRDGVWRRDFDRGVALVNPTDQPATVSLDPGLRRIRGAQAPTVNNGAPASTVTLEPKDGLLLVRE